MKRLFSIILILAILTTPIFSQVSGESLIKDLYQKWSSIKDLQMKFSITLYTYSTKGESLSQKMTMEMLYISQPQVLRINFLEPALFAGQIVLLDSEKKLMRIYIPSTKQIMESELTQTSTFTASLFNIPGVSGKEEGFTFDVTETIEKNQKIYKITGKPNTPELKTIMSYFELFISKDELKPLRFKMYDIEQRLYMDIIWLEIKINQNLSLNKIRTLPQGKAIKQKELQNITPLPFFAPAK
ncbi:MAG: LolA family protein [Dictyoglomaceae bacterium]